MPISKTDKYPIEGYATVFATMNFDVADDLESRIPEKTTFRAKWYDSKGNVASNVVNDKIVLQNSPQRVWFWIQTADLGVGHAKVELYHKDTLLGKSEFDIVDMKLGDFNNKYPYLTPEDKDKKLQKP